MHKGVILLVKADSRIDALNETIKRYKVFENAINYLLLND